MLALLFAALLLGVTGNPTPAPQQYGVLEGGVARCTDGQDIPSTTASVSIDGQPYIVGTDENGQFALPAVVGTYTVTAQDGEFTGHRYNAPVIADQAIDIGILELDPTAAIWGCADEG